LIIGEFSEVCLGRKGCANAGDRFDPAGFILEHYVDGDLLDMKEPTHHTKAAPDNLHVWGEWPG
jgi:hypothetical protein